MFVVVALLLGSAEAGCGPNGCCYCHQTEGYVINTGSYKTNCDVGSKKIIYIFKIIFTPFLDIF